MKRLLLVLFIALSTQQLWADNWLTNGDFSTGIDGWHGDARSLSEYISSNPINMGTNLPNNGLVIELKSDKWSKITQNFNGMASSGTMTITFMVSDDFAFSTDGSYYKNIPKHIDYQGWKPFKIPNGTWLVFLSDLGKAEGTYYPFKPLAPGKASTQTFTAKVSGMTPNLDKTIALAFPPGTGVIILLNVSIDSGDNN
jgi:hypothetical protein